MLFLLESILACAAFAFVVYIISRDPVKILFNYPPAIVERCRQLGLVDQDNSPRGKVFYIKKGVAMVVIGIVLGVMVQYINGCETFWSGVLTAYALWCVVNWFDALVLDCWWFCHDKHFVIPGTEDMVDAYHDYGFHIRGALISMLLAIPASLIAGLVVVL